MRMSVMILSAVVATVMFAGCDSAIDLSRNYHSTTDSYNLTVLPGGTESVYNDTNATGEVSVDFRVDCSGAVATGGTITVHAVITGDVPDGLMLSKCRRVDVVPVIEETEDGATIDQVLGIPDNTSGQPVTRTIFLMDGNTILGQGSCVQPSIVQNTNATSEDDNATQ